MTVGQVIAIFAVLASIYGTSPAKMECLSWHESRHDTEAVNGIHVSVGQWNPDTFEWMLGMALEDESCPHREYLRAHPTPDDYLSAMILMTWAVAHGYESHWSADRFCWDVQ